jgi:hypothetical protein
MRSYLDFEITVTPISPSRYTLIVSGPGGEATSTLIVPDDDAYRGYVERLRRLDTDEESLVQIGQALFRAIFQGPVRDVYARSQGILSREQGLRLRLVIPPGETAIHALPWEFLYDPDQGPLALIDAPVVRYLPQQDRVPSLAAPLPLKVLLSAAQTDPPVEVERELRAVQEALASRPDSIAVTLEPNLTTAKLQRLLREEFHIWHFVGHGGFGEHGTGVLLFEDGTGGAEPVSALQLNVMLNRSGLRLVVLDACSTAELATDTMRSVAPALIRAQVPAVVAMQFQVPEEATRAFASEFYRALAEGFPIDTCVTEGRRAVMNVTGLKRPDWGIPVIYTRAPDGRLFDSPANQVPGVPAVAPGNQTQGRSIGQGLAALSDLMQTTAVREDVIAFRADFMAAGEQFALMADYKDVHDQLHSLQFHCYNPIIQEIRRLPDDEDAWENLSNYELTLQGIVGQLQEVAGRPSFSPTEMAWVADLGQARGELAGSIEGLDLKVLKKAVRLLNRVLTIQPAQFNARLNAAARALRLGTIAQGLTRVRERLPDFPLDTDKVAQFEVGVVALAGLSTRLAMIVSEHDGWQAVDLELRRIEATIDTSLDELELSWADVQEMCAPLYTNVEETWATTMRADAAKLDAALAAGDETKMRHFFRRYRRQAGDRFYRVDIELKRMTDDLRKVGEPLTVILRLIAG